MKRFSLDLYSVLTNAKVPELFGKKSLLMCTAEATLVKIPSIAQTITTQKFYAMLFLVTMIIITL